MAYYAPYIDSSGAHVPTYAEIRDHIVAQMRGIYGEDIYLENDSQDYQMISAFASMADDVLQHAVAIYNNLSPATAIGAQLDQRVAINGIQRKAATKSMVLLEIKGTSGTKILNGIAADYAGVKWMLPEIVEIGDEGTVTVEARAANAGRVLAAPNTITSIITPTRGWTSVTNPADAVPGMGNETDAELRARQVLSTANPSSTVLQGIIGGIAQLAGVTRWRVYENDTSATDANGIPPHSISAVVEGGDDVQIAGVIYRRKTPGGGTYGSTEVIIPAETDELDDTPIHFYRPTYVEIEVKITLKTLTGYTSAIPLEIKAAVADYINSLGIGVSVLYSALWAAAMSASADLRTPAYSVTAISFCATGGTPDTNDMELAFNAAARAYTASVTITEVS